MHVVEVEENKPSHAGRDLETRMMEVVKKKVAKLARLTGGPGNAQVDRILSDLLLAVEAHGSTTIVNQRLAELDKTLGKEPSQRIKDSMQELKDILADRSNDGGGGIGGGSEENLLNKRIVDLNTAEEELEQLEKGQGPVSSTAPPSKTTKSTKMDHVLSQTITLRGSDANDLDSDDQRRALAAVIATSIGADVDAVTINHITGVKLMGRRLLSALEVNVAYSVYLSSEVSAKKAFSGMSDLFARVPSALKSLANDLAKNPF